MNPEKPRHFNLGAQDSVEKNAETLRPVNSFSEKFTPEIKGIRRKFLESIKEVGRGEVPLPREDWDLIWVISGPPMDIAEEFKIENAKEKVLIGYDDEITKRDVKKKINESRERLETGIKIAKKVTAKRLNKEIKDLTLEDIRSSSPEIYWNATNWANDNLRRRIKEGFLNKYKFPAEKVVVSPNLDIKHTGDQFKKIEDKVIQGKRKIVIVSDIYHLPRIKMLYLDRGKIDKTKVVLYPSEPKKIPVGKALRESKVIPEYLKKED